MSSLSLLTIDLNALVGNWKLLQQKVAPSTRCAAVVKANAYGLGIAPVAKVLFANGCRVFFVATLEEGIELRTLLAKSDCEIIVFGGLFYDTEESLCSAAWLRYSLTPVLYSVKHISRWVLFSSHVQKILPSVVKVDTGMHRMGLSVDEFNEQLLSDVMDRLKPSYIMSHFAFADKSEHSLNSNQIMAFDDCLMKIKSRLPDIQVSMCNSAGIFLDGDVFYDLVRPGIALYGGNPSPSKPNPMKPVVKLTLGVMQLKVVASGDSVGYGASYIAQKETRLAIVSGGYADGLHRALSNTGFAYCKGQRVPIVGRVSMDTMIFDVTNVPGKDPTMIEILGECQTVDDLAQAAGTIAYEILTSLGSRFQRNYLYPNGSNE